jgi:lactate racemase
MHVQLAYGRSGLEIELPDDLAITVIEPRAVAAVPDEESVLLAALREPIESRSLASCAAGVERVAVVFSDLTRPMPNGRVLPVVLAELERAGVADDQIVLINALGTHRPQTDRELRQMLGDAVVGRYHIVQHDAWDESNLAEVGSNRLGRRVRVNRAYAEALLRVLTGFIEPHLFAGFSGGPKSVLPGIADMESILDNHGPEMIAHPRATWAVTWGNPIWEEMLQVAASTDPGFVLNVALNRERQITAAFGGEMAAAHSQGVEYVRSQALYPVAQRFDVVIASNGGYPMDLNLYQAVKGMSAAAQVVRPGGDIIVVAECWDGIPAHGEYQRLLWEADSPHALLERVLSPGFRCHDQWEAQLQAQIQVLARVHVYADGLSDEDLRRALVIPCRSVEETVAMIVGRNREASIAVLPDGFQTLPYLVE